MRVTAGIVLSSDLFQQEWFWYLGAFVAFNTLVFVGLSIGRFVPWPRQPDEVTLDEWRHRFDRWRDPSPEDFPRDGSPREE